MIMLVNDYFYTEFSKDYVNGQTTPLEQIFFSAKKSEFKLFFYYSLNHLPKESFLKKFRYKYAFNNNDFSNFVKMLTRRGLLSKFRQLFISIIKYFFFLKTETSFIKYISLINTKSTYWLYSFYEILNIIFLFKLTFHRLDKNVRKYNRKRKIKISFKYNYIPPFKRSKWSMKLMIKFSKFGLHNKIDRNIVQVLNNILTGKQDNILYKLNVFTFRKIKNFSFQKTLMTSI